MISGNLRRWTLCPSRSMAGSTSPATSIHLPSHWRRGRRSSHRWKPTPSRRRWTRCCVSLIRGECGFDGSGLGSGAKSATLEISDFENVLTVPVGDGPELMEKEPNNSTNDATHLEVPSAVTCSIEKPGDEDHFAFDSKKGEKLLLEIQS